MHTTATMHPHTSGGMGRSTLGDCLNSCPSTNCVWAHQSWLAAFQCLAASPYMCQPMLSYRVLTIPDVVRRRLLHSVPGTQESQQRSSTLATKRVATCMLPVQQLLQRAAHVLPPCRTCRRKSTPPRQCPSSAPCGAAPARASGARTGRGWRARTSAPWRRPPGPPRRCSRPPPARRPGPPATRRGGRARFSLMSR